MGFINLFLKAELTCIPEVLSRYFGKYYSNTLCNAATWIFALWCILHLVFDQFLHNLFRRMKYKTYLRERLLAALWYLGFYSSVLFYTGATLFRNDTEFFKLRIGHVPYDVISSQSIIGFTVLLTFLLHSAFWESLRNGSVICSATYSLLTLFALFAHYMRAAEIAFSQIAILSVGQVLLNSTKCLNILTAHILPNSLVSALLVKFLMFASILSIIAGYILTVPLIILPFVIRIFTTIPNTLLYLCFSFLLAFLVSSVYKSVIHRLVIHWLNHHHNENDEDKHVCKNTTDCILYEPRTDVAYTLSIMRREAKLRKEANIPSSRNKLMQTLKCVIAVKKKLQQQRQQDSNSKKASKDTTEPESSVEITEITEESNQEANEDVAGTDKIVDGVNQSSSGSESPAIITYDDGQKSKCDFKLPTPTITITDVTNSDENNHKSNKSNCEEISHSDSKDVPSITVTDCSTPRIEIDDDTDSEESDVNNSSQPLSSSAPSNVDKKTTNKDHSQATTTSSNSQNEPGVYVVTNADPSNIEFVDVSTEEVGSENDEATETENINSVSAGKGTIGIKTDVKNGDKVPNDGNVQSGNCTENVEISSSTSSGDENNLSS